jgi:hypothetical protein
MNRQRYCTPPSRIFGGDPSALLAQLTTFYSIGQVVTLTTPYNFQMDTDQCPFTQFWHMSRFSFNIYSPTSAIGALAANQVRAFLMPNNLVGSLSSIGAGIGGFQQKNVGVELQKLISDISNDTVTTTGIQTFVFAAPIEVPPGWFIRLLILDNESGAQLTAGTQLAMQFARAQVPINFPSLL